MVQFKTAVYDDDEANRQPAAGKSAPGDRSGPPLPVGNRAGLPGSGTAVAGSASVSRRPHFAAALGASAAARLSRRLRATNSSIGSFAEPRTGPRMPKMPGLHSAVCQLAREAGASADPRRLGGERGGEAVAAIEGDEFVHWQFRGTAHRPSDAEDAGTCIRRPQSPREAGASADLVVIGRRLVVIGGAGERVHALLSALDRVEAAGPPAAGQESGAPKRMGAEVAGCSVLRACSCRVSGRMRPPRQGSSRHRQRDAGWI